MSNVNEEAFNNTHKKSLREILPKGSGHAYKRSAPLSSAPIGSTEGSLTRHVPEDAEPFLRSRRMPKIPKYLIIFVGLVFILLVVFVVGSFFTRATIEVTPKQARVNVDETFPAAVAAGADELEFGTVSNVVSEKIAVPASGTKEVSERATGEITIYNDFSPEPQTLIAKTRFETKDGKIYRISQSLSIPGQKTENGKIVPGSIVAKVTADQPGAEYNIGPADFTIPGFKDTPRYDKFYARSKSPFVGGLVGTVSNISEADRAEAEAELKEKLATKATEQKSLTAPAGHILLDDAVFTTTTFETEQAKTGNSVSLVGKVTYTGIVFSEEKIASFLASRYVPDYDGEPVRLESTANLKLALAEDSDLKTESPQTIDVSLKGSAHLVWLIDEEELKEAAAGYTKKNFQLVLADFPMIESAKIKITPPWVRSVPKEIEKIKVDQIIAEDSQ